MRRPRTVRQEARQYEVFQMHVVGRTRLSTVARQLGISMHTASSDLYHEGRRRADELEGTFVPYSLAKPEIVVKKADLAAMLESWGTIKTA